MKSYKFLSITCLVLSIIVQIVQIFTKDNSILLNAIIFLCLAIYFSVQGLHERVGEIQYKQQDEPQTPPQRNLQGEIIAKGVRELPCTKGTLQSVCEIEDMARSYLNKEHTTGMFLVVTRLNSLRRTLEMQVRMNERNTPKK